jgi:coatomer protein complex subunit epsilon
LCSVFLSIFPSEGLNVYTSPGAYKTLVALTLPASSSSDYTATLLYQIRAYIALGDIDSARKLVPAGTENVALKAADALARYIEGADKDAALEEMRDLSVEIEGDDVEGTERDKATVRVLAGTAFARAGEIEEALETLGADTEELEAYVSMSI